MKILRLTSLKKKNKLLKSLKSNFTACLIQISIYNKSFSIVVIVVSKQFRGFSRPRSCTRRHETFETIDRENSIQASFKRSRVVFQSLFHFEFMEKGHDNSWNYNFWRYSRLHPELFLVQFNLPDIWNLS